MNIKCLQSRAVNLNTYTTCIKCLSSPFTVISHTTMMNFIPLLGLIIKKYFRDILNNVHNGFYNWKVHFHMLE